MILLPGLDKSLYVSLSYIQNISVMNIWFSDLSTSSPRHCSAISSFLHQSKQKLLVLIFMTSPHSVISQFITGMLASWPNTPSRHCSPLTLAAKPPSAAGCRTALCRGRAPQPCSPLVAPLQTPAGLCHHPCRERPTAWHWEGNTGTSADPAVCPTVLPVN